MSTEYECPLCGEECVFKRISYTNMIMVECNNKECDMAEFNEFDIAEATISEVTNGQRH